VAGEKPELEQVLNEKQLKFCQEYVLDFNATQAAIRSGYSKKTANRIASALLSKIDVSNEVQRLIKNAESKAIATAQETLETISTLVRSNLYNVFDENDCIKSSKEIPKELWPAIQSIESEELFDGTGRKKTVIGLKKKIKLWDKNKAIDTLAKYHKLLSDSPPVFNSQTNIQVNQTNNVYAKVVICLPPKRPTAS